MSFEVGTEIASRYTITRVLGAGGMGEVYAARDAILEAEVALKTLKPELQGSHVALERFRREIALARRVTDSHVCRIYDVGEHADRVFLTMELLDGKPLAGPLPIDELERIAPQLVRGLQALHAAGIVHRDFKTANVIVADGRAIVTDFGLARTVDGDESTLSIDSGLLGTPAYMAPEQVEGRVATPASDVYALGIVLFELATGKRPFDEDTAMATATARLTRDPPKPSSLRADLPPHWDAIILRCLAREPSGRPRLEDVLASPSTTRRTVIVAGGLGLVAAGFGAWRLFGGPPDGAKVWPANAIAAVLPVEPAEKRGDRWSIERDTLRFALTVDIHDMLTTSAIRMVNLYQGGMYESFGGTAFHFLDAPDSTVAAWEMPSVAAVVRTKLVGRAPIALELSIEYPKGNPIVTRVQRPQTQAMFLVEDIANAIAKALGARAPRPGQDTREHPAGIYERYGDALAHLWNGEARRTTQLGHFFEIEPSFARAAARYANRIVSDGQHGIGPQVLAEMDRALALVDRALAIDPNLALAHATRGAAAMIKWDWKTTDKSTARALELAPTHERCNFHRGMYWMLTANVPEQLAHYERQRELDHRRDMALAMLANIYNNARMYPETVAHVDRVLPRIKNPNVRLFLLVHVAVAYSELGRYADAIATADKVLAMPESQKDAEYELARLVRVYAMSGDRKSAIALRDKIYETSPIFNQVGMDDALGELDKALEKMETVVDGHNLHAAFIKIWKVSPQMRSHPRFQALVKRVGVP